MTSVDTLEKPTYEQFCTEWLEELSIDDLNPFQKGVAFATSLVAQWLEVTTDDDDFIICDGSGDGGIDIAYLQRADADPDTLDDDSIEGDTWYLVQSKYGTSFTGSDTILQEGNKVVRTLLGQTPHLSTVSQQLVDKLSQFRQQASDADRIVLVFATTDPIAQQDRDALERVKIVGREQVMPGFDVEELSLMTIWEALDDVEQPRLTVPVVGQFVEQSSGLLVGRVSLVDLFAFLKSYQSHTGNLDQLYEKNVRQFLGNRRKINKGIANTLNANPEKFGLYNNGITIVVSNYSKSPDGITVSVNDPYVVNGCQTTRTIWQVLDSKLNAGGTGQDTTAEAWKERVRRGGVVTKIVRSDEAEIGEITRYTNSQNSVREQDFIALHSGFQRWRDDMGRDYGIYLEIQRGGIASQKAWEKQHPDARVFEDYVNAFDLVKVYGAGWLDVPGVAFGKNPPFLPNGAVYQRMVSRSSAEPSFGARDLYAAYKVKCAADQIGFGRNAERPSRRQSRFLFYHIVMSMLGEIVLLTPELHQPDVPPSALTEAVIKLSDPSAKSQFDTLCGAAVGLLDRYLTAGGDNSAHNEVSFTETHNADLNAFLKAENLGKSSHSPLLVQQLALHNMAFGMPGLGGGQSAREYVSDALL